MPSEFVEKTNKEWAYLSIQSIIKLRWVIIVTFCTSQWDMRDMWDGHFSVEYKRIEHIVFL